VCYVLFLKKSLTSLELNSRTGTWCGAGALLWAAGGAPAALPLPPQALLEAVGVVCCRPPSLVGLFALELRSWVWRFPWPGRRQLFTWSARFARTTLQKHYRFSPAPLIVGMVRTVGERSGVLWWRYKTMELSNRRTRGKLRPCYNQSKCLGSCNIVDSTPSLAASRRTRDTIHGHYAMSGRGFFELSIGAMCCTITCSFRSANLSIARHP
jgi:hypothetical protein